MADSGAIKLADAVLSNILSRISLDGHQRRLDLNVYWMAPEVVEKNPGGYEASADKR
mgnify:CR=1 FL=1